MSRAAKFIAVAISLAAATAGAEVSGHLVVGDQRVEPRFGVAVPGTSPWDPSRNVLKVLLGTSPIDLAGVVDALDRERAIRDRFEGDFVIATLGLDGEVDNMYAFFEEGYKNYGLAQQGEASIEELTESRVTGRAWTSEPASLGDESVEFELSFAVEVLPPREGGEPLGAKGGPAGAAYLVYVTGLLEGDAAALVAHGSLEQAAHLRDLEGEMLGWEMESIVDSAPQAMAVLGGERFGDYAILDVQGKDWGGDSVKGQVKMVLAEDGQWRFAEERLELDW